MIAAPGASPSYDAFVSYRQQEPTMTWVREVLVPALERAPRAGGDALRLCVDHRNFRPGVPVVVEMGRAVEASTYTVAVMTPPYLESSFTELEAVMAQHLGLEQAMWLLVPVMREEVRPPLHLRSLLWVDMTDDGGFEASAGRLAERLGQPPPSAVWQPPGGPRA